jgi:hypothetical protein
MTYLEDFEENEKEGGMNESWKHLFFELRQSSLFKTKEEARS